MGIAKKFMNFKRFHAAAFRAFVPLSGSEFIFKIIIAPMAMQQLLKNRLNR
jgi:hypothetical protein